MKKKFGIGIRLVSRPIRWILLYLLKLAGIASGGPLVARVAGMTALRDHYYSPVPSAKDFAGPGFWQAQSDMPGIDLRADDATHYLCTALPPHLQLFRSIFPNIEKSKTAAANDFYLLNGTYMAVDAHFYFSYILHLKPKKIIEVGSGQSTLVALAAIRHLRQQNHTVELICIEPFAHAYLKDLAAQGELTLLQKNIQAVDLSLFTALRPNDIFFLDSTHVLREGGDVQYEYLEILPRLQAGIYVHVHDISLPKRYPKVYFDGGLYWNEQYLLQAYLINNPKVQITWPGNYMMLTKPDLMHETFPEIAAMRSAFPSSEPTAFWFKTVA